MKRRTLLSTLAKGTTTAGVIGGLINPFHAGWSTVSFYIGDERTKAPQTGALENGHRRLDDETYALEFGWWVPEGSRRAFEFTIDRSVYVTESRRSRSYVSAFNAAKSSQTAERLASELADQAMKTDSSPDAQLKTAVSFVRSFEYADDRESKRFPEYHRSPVETLVDGRGDCKDTTYLLAGILSSSPFEYRTAMMFVPEHMLLGVRSSDLPDRLDVDPLPETGYVPIETTSTDTIGELSRQPLLGVYDGGFKYFDRCAAADTTGEFLGDPSRIDVILRSPETARS